MTRHFRILLIGAALALAASGFALMKSNDALEQTLASASNPGGTR